MGVSHGLDSHELYSGGTSASCYALLSWIHADFCRREGRGRLDWVREVLGLLGGEWQVLSAGGSFAGVFGVDGVRCREIRVGM